MKNQSKNKQTLLKRGKNAGDQVVIGLVLHLIGWERGREFSRPITEQSKEKLMQSRITFNWKLLKHADCSGPFFFFKPYFP